MVVMSDPSIRKFKLSRHRFRATCLLNYPRGGTLLDTENLFCNEDGCTTV